MNTLSIPPYMCRCRGLVSSIALCEKVEIRPGFFTICGNCLFVSIFTEAMTLRPATHEDLKIAFARRAFVAQMMQLQKARGWRAIG